MRNLKRVLALAMALVMAISMMVVGASAASYTDAESINETYSEAITVMSGVKMFEGDTEGNFLPEMKLTRAMAAVMMARLKLGKTYADNLPDDTTTAFTDVANTWYAGEVQYCQTIGLIAGRGDGTFDPEGELTGVAFAKLILGALGYDAEAEGYVGANWASNIYVDAIENNLLVDGVELDEVVSRQVAAQMMFQVLLENTVSYITAFDKATMTQVKIGHVENDDETFADKYYPGLGLSYGGFDDWGNPAEYTWVYKTKALYTKWYAPVAEYFTAVDECDIVKDLGEKKNTKFYGFVDGYNDEVLYVLDEDGYVEDYADPNGQWKAVGKSYTQTGTGVWTRIYDTDEWGYVAVSINTYFGQVTKVVTEKADKNGHIIRDAGVELTVFTAADEYETFTVAKENYFETDEEFAKKDLVLVYICNGEVAAIELADIEIETVKRIAYEDNDQIRDTVTTKDGDVYAENVNFFLGSDLKTKTEYYMLLDSYGNIIAAVEVEDEASYITGVISRLNWVDTNKDDEDGWARATIVNMDAEALANTELVYNFVDEQALVYADKTDDCAPETGCVSTDRNDNGDWHDILYVYEQNRDGSYDIIDQAAEAEFTKLSPKAYNKVTVDGKTYRTNGNTVYLIKTLENGKAVYTSYVGYKNVPAINPVGDDESFTVQYFLDEDKEYIGEVFVDATKLLFTGATSIVYIVDTDVVYTDNGVDYFEAYVGTEANDFALAEDVTVAGEGLYTLYFNADEEVIEFVEIDTYVTVTAIEGDVLMYLTEEDTDEEVDDTVPFYAVSEYGVDEGDISDIAENDEVLLQYKNGKVVAVYYEAVED